MRIALCITCYNSVRFLGKQFYYLSRLNPKPDIIYWVENNSNDGTLEYIARHCEVLKLPYKIISYHFIENAVQYLKDHNGTAYDVIAIARQIGLQAFRNDKCDYGIFVDDDLYFTESDALQKLTQYSEDIVGGTYQRVYPEGIYVASKWGTVKYGVYRLKTIDKVARPFDFPAITSGGCLCLSKKAIQDRRLNFYPVQDEYNTSSSASEDYGFCLKASKLGYKLILDNSTKLLHMYRETITDIKPWTVVNGKYADFGYKKKE